MGALIKERHLAESVYYKGGGYWKENAKSNHRVKKFHDFKIKADQNLMAIKFTSILSGMS